MPPVESIEILSKLRTICLALPMVEEKLSHGAPLWFIKGKKSFAVFADHHHKIQHATVWLAASNGIQEMLIDSNPNLFFRPPYLGHKGWIGVFLDVPETDWQEVEGLIREAFCCVAPPKIAALLELNSLGRN